MQHLGHALMLQEGDKLDEAQKGSFLRHKDEGRISIPYLVLSV
jgi:hypothetical protein